MKLEKLVEILNLLAETEPNADVIFDNYRNCDEFMPNTIYDLISVSIESKNDKISLKLAFEERENKTPKNQCRMKNMNIRLLNNNEVKEEDKENE